MEMAKVTSKGQITIPVSIRKRLGINEGDKLLFIDSPDGVIMVNPDSLASAGAQGTQPAAEAAPGPAPGQRSQNADMRSVAAKPRVIAQPRAVSAPRPAVTGAAVTTGADPTTEKKPAAPTENEEARPKGLDVGALLDEIRSIGSNTLTR